MKAPATVLHLMSVLNGVGASGPKFMVKMAHLKELTLLVQDEQVNARQVPIVLHVYHTAPN